jgi:aspartate carbamoyltransferase catalytic subunit
MLERLKKRNQKYIEISNLESTLPQLDVLYMTRIQRERFADLKTRAAQKSYVLNRRKLQMAKSDCLVMHPLPDWTKLHVTLTTILAQSILSRRGMVCLSGWRFAEDDLLREDSRFAA